MCRNHEPEESIKIEHNGHAVTVEIHRDETPQDPRRDFDNLGTLSVKRGSRYGRSDDAAEDFESFRDGFRRFRGVAVWLFIDPAEAYECEPRTANAVLYVDAARIVEEYGPEKPARSRNYRARRALLAELEAYNTWASGDVFGYVVKDADGEELPDAGGSVWGFYGLEDVKEEATRFARDYVEREAEAAADYAARC